MKRENVVEMDFVTRRKLASSVIMNAKELVYTGQDGKQVKKVIALVPVSLMKVDNDSYQREAKEHVMKMVNNWDDSQCTMLLVNYRKEEGWFYVIDGQHRTLAADILGIEYLACELFTDLTVEEEAKRYLEYNTGTKSLNPFDTFKANIRWGEPNDTAIKEVCDKHGVSVLNRKAKTKKLKSVTAAREIYREGGALALSWIFSLLEDAHWEDFSDSYSSNILRSLRSVYMNNIDNLANVRKKLLDFMIKSNPSEVIGLGNAEYPNLGPTTRTKLVFECIINDGVNVPVSIESKKSSKIA